MKITYTAQLVDQAGNTYTWSGSQQLNSNTPQTADFLAATNAMAADIQAQITTGPASFAFDQVTDGNTPTSQSA